eukprot:8946004-Alexandrium_andersonii.AAC.1
MRHPKRGIRARNSVCEDPTPAVGPPSWPMGMSQDSARRTSHPNCALELPSYLLVLLLGQ